MQNKNQELINNNLNNTESDEIISKLESTITENNNKLNDLQRQNSTLKRDYEQKLNIEQNKQTLLKEDIETHNKLYSDLKKSYDLILQNMNEKHSTITQEEVDQLKAELNQTHVDEISRIKAE